MQAGLGVFKCIQNPERGRARSRWIPRKTFARQSRHTLTVEKERAFRVGLRRKSDSGMKNAGVLQPGGTPARMGGESSRKLASPASHVRGAGSRGVPRLLLSESGLDTTWWKSLAVIVGHRQRPDPQIRTHYLSRNLCEIRVLPPLTKLVASTFVHVCLSLLLVRVPFSYGLLRQESDPDARGAPERHYSLRYVRLAGAFPVFSSPGRRQGPQRSSPPGTAAPAGSGLYHPLLRIVSKPPRPDNRHRTVIQTDAPPDLRLAVDPDLPNLFIIKQPEVVRPTLKLGNSRPLVHDREQAIASAPQAFLVQGVPGGASLLISAGQAQSPHMPVPPTEGVSTSSAERSASQDESVKGAPGSNSGQHGEILVLTTDPGNLSNLSQLPSGSQFGLLSLSPRVGPEGGSGGAPKGDGFNSGRSQGGAEGNGYELGGNGGSKDAGGSGRSGGASPAGVSLPGIVGGSKRAGGSGHLTGDVASMVFAVKVMPHLRRNSLVVSTGPIGGSGLGVYGVLRGGRIYTVFLPMPGKNWILEYSRCHEPSPFPRSDSRGGVIKLEIAVAPPDPQEQFDFTRTPVPLEKRNKLIILHGLIREDGSVDELEVYQGVDPRIDRAALAAFQQWKFKPALRENRPISIEILVGIPVTVPGA